MQSWLLFLAIVPFVLGVWLLLQTGQGWRKGAFLDLPIYVSRDTRPRLFRLVVLAGFLAAVLLMLGSCGLLFLV